MCIRDRFSTAALLVAVVGLAGFGYVYGYLAFSKLQSHALCNVHNVDVCKAELSGKPFNVLAIGSDSRAGLPSSICPEVGCGQVGGQRSDVVKVFHVDPSAGTISVVSFPRDTMVSLLANQNLFGSYNRLNVNYQNGPALLVRTIEANFGITINHVVQVGFGGLAGAVNALGGVYMYFPYPALDHYSSLDIPHTGCQKLNGYQALAVARSRHFEYWKNGYWQYDGSSDYGRIDRQNQFLRALIDAAKNQYNPVTIASFMNALPQGLQIDDQFGYNELIGLAATFRHFNPANLNAYTLPTYPGVSSSLGDVLYVNQPAAQATLVKVFGQLGTAGGLTEPTNPPPNSSGATPLPPAVATPTAPPATTTVPPGSVHSTGSHAVTTTTVPLHTEYWYTFNPIACTPK